MHFLGEFLTSTIKGSPVSYLIDGFKKKVQEHAEINFLIKNFLSLYC